VLYLHEQGGNDGEWLVRVLIAEHRKANVRVIDQHVSVVPRGGSLASTMRLCEVSQEARALRVDGVRKKLLRPLAISVWRNFRGVKVGQALAWKEGFREVRVKTGRVKLNQMERIGEVAVWWFSEDNFLLKSVFFAGCFHLACPSPLHI